jgi:predicted Kef-type K+ transport protein
VVEAIVLLIALLAGLLVKQVSLPPLVGFLIAGFTIPYLAPWQPEFAQLNFTPLADLGVTLLLFGIGLKLDVRSLLRPFVWGVASLHMLVSVALLTVLLVALKSVGLKMLVDLQLEQFMVIGFALSFSSTVFAVKVLEERGEMASLHGQIAIGILIMQDIVAVVYLSLMGDKSPEWYAIFVLLLIPLRSWLYQLLMRCGHGELLVLAGFLYALGGYALFEAVGLKGDLGALVVGVLLASHGKASELSKVLMHFKDLLLVGFFLGIGQGGLPDNSGWLMVLVVSLAISYKLFLFLLLLTRFKVRSRAALFSSLALNNYSEFGLIVLALAVKEGVLPSQWLAIVAISLSLSFVIGSMLESRGYLIYSLLRSSLLKLETKTRLREQQPVDIGQAQILVMGMGRVGTGAYNYLHARYGDVVVGFEEDVARVERHEQAGRRVLIGDATDRELWERLDRKPVQQVILALSNHAETLRVARLLRRIGYAGVIAAVARYPDEVEELKALDVIAFNVFAEAGAGFAEHVYQQVTNNGVVPGG